MTKAPSASCAVLLVLTACDATDALRPYGADVPATSVTATRVGWSTDARAWRGLNSVRVRFDCPVGGAPGSVYGSDPYTDDSSVCTAGMHAGRIGIEGGVVVIEVRAGAASYAASTRYGVSTNAYTAYDGSFSVL